MLVDSRLAVEGAEMANVFLSFIHEEEWQWPQETPNSSRPNRGVSQACRC